MADFVNEDIIFKILNNICNDDNLLFYEKIKLIKNLKLTCKKYNFWIDHYLQKRTTDFKNFNFDKIQKNINLKNASYFNDIDGMENDLIITTYKLLFSKLINLFFITKKDAEEIFNKTFVFEHQKIIVNKLGYKFLHRSVIYDYDSPLFDIFTEHMIGRIFLRKRKNNSLKEMILLLLHLIYLSFESLKYFTPNKCILKFSKRIQTIIMQTCENLKNGKVITILDGKRIQRNLNFSDEENGHNFLLKNLTIKMI
jgi:hypothetical protein